MEVLRSITQPSSPRERGYGTYVSAIPRAPATKQRTTYEAAASDPRAQQPSGSLPGAGLPAPMSSVRWDIPATSLVAGAAQSAAALGRHAPHERGARHSDQEEQAPPSLAFEYEARSQSLPPGLPPWVLVLQGLVCMTKCVNSIALDIGLGGLAATQSEKPTALDILRQDVNALGRETRELHGRVNRRVPASALMELRRSLNALVYEAQGQMPSYKPQRNSYRAVLAYTSCESRGCQPTFHSQALTTPVEVVRKTQPRFEEGSSSTLQLLPSSQGKILRIIVLLKTPHVERRVNDVCRAMSDQDRNGSNEEMLQLATLNRANHL
ncbi:hypothetical protein PHPALM_31495 [Phytophthora palmivora]|uniref:Uncharacterized protein n=1 Tax=Phytophthora palmivora TaxID=4796 RepID=A0A2P4X2G0_9STRA|nr:hypothetical protein PHPALM_31495 [Phytophthora palmivora]